MSLASDRPATSGDVAFATGLILFQIALTIFLLTARNIRVQQSLDDLCRAHHPECVVE